jgi:hypothetical protein
LREPCQGHAASTKHPRRVSAILHPLPSAAPSPPPSSPSRASRSSGATGTLGCSAGPFLLSGATSGWTSNSRSRRRLLCLGPLGRSPVPSEPDLRRRSPSLGCPTPLRVRSGWQ